VYSAKELGEIQPGSPSTEAPNTGGTWGEIKLAIISLCLRNGARYAIDIVSLLYKANRNLYALYQMVLFPIFQ